MWPDALYPQGLVSFSNQLSSTSVRKMMQDSYDNVWISTFNGLNRYDGSKINVYCHSDSNSSSLAHNICSALFELEPGKVMVGSDIGVQIYSYDTDSFTQVPLVMQNGDTIHAHVSQIVRRRDNTVIACTMSKGLFSYDGMCFHELTLPFVKYVPMGVMEDPTGTFWVYDTQGNIYRDNLFVGYVENIRDLVSSTSGRVYACSLSDGLKLFDNAERTFVDAPGAVSDCAIWSMRPIDKDRVLLCTDGDGLYVYDENVRNCYRPEIRIYEYPIETSNVKDAFVDSFGNMWVAIYWKGVVVQPAESSVFHYIGRRSVTRNTIGVNCVTSIARSGKDMLWVGTDHEGLYHIKSDGTEGRHYGNGSLENMPSTVMKVFEDCEGNVWLGSSVDGVFLMDMEGGSCTPLENIAAGADELKSCFDIVQDSDGDIWMSSNGTGLFRLEHNSHKWKLTRYRNLLTNDYSRALLVYGSWLLVGTSDGLDILQKSDGQLVHKFHLLQKTSLNCLKMSNDGSVWTATSTGLYKIRFDTYGAKILERYSVDNGLPNNMVLAVEPVSEGKLWISTDKGLALIDAIDGEILSYTAADGLENEQFSGRASLNVDGDLYFGGINGITFFSSKNIVSKHSLDCIPGKIRIVSLNIGGRPITVLDKTRGKQMTETWVPNAKSVRLPMIYNAFSLELSTMNVCETHQSFSYSLDSSEWVELAEGQNHVALAGLRAGEHIISVRESGSGECSLNVRIMPAWYQSPVAIALYIYLVVSILLLICMLFIQRKKSEQNEEKHNLEVEEVRRIHRQEVEKVRNIKRVEELDIESPDDHLMRRVMDVINSNLSNPELDVEFIAERVGISRVQLYRRIKGITNSTPHELLAEIRFNEAKRLLTEKKRDISDVSNSLGFKSLSSFSSAFKNHFGVSPSDYMKDIHTQKSDN